ncbi:tRNA-modifying protein YgfZ [Candidatus Hoaglandella endobia]|uniref:tRNA-modifying protein YgfZ n=1 Tax=Candidatus Hoaglandella endobia TaxID=1778263 RepID=A0A143WUF9_9ENTR|nr:tRNA-modifying protein YgfZ [Candidatus Hoaglandella endobia]CUX97338.1 tRNA-modifying protein YgfZ [Candidatus Hoaglandella endobia]
MPYQVHFQPRLPYSSSNLPLTLISLEAWALVTLSGVDTVKYLQGQLTCDVASLDANSFSFAAHCNAKGKMLSHLCVFYRGEGMAYIERRSVLDSQLAELKKYAVFSKTNIIVDDQAVLLGLAGFQAPAALSSLFYEIPDASSSVVQYQDTTLLYYNLPAPRFLLITTLKKSYFIKQKLEGQAQFNNSRQWLVLDIEAGYPVIDLANSAQLIPQAANVQALDGISFNKGCYAGQEIIARTKYRCANKRQLYWLVGKAGHRPTIGDNLELKMGENWHRTGTILAACQLEDGNFCLQAVLNNNLSPDSVLRVRNDSDDSGALFIQQLPYIINK